MLPENNTDILVSIIAGSLLLFLLCVFIVAFSALFLRKRRQYRAEREQLRSQFAETLLQTQLEIKEQTLQHIASELHDNLGQVASLIKIHLNTLTFSDIDSAQRKVEDTKELVRQLILDLKTLSVSLNSDRVIRLGIVRGIEAEVERLNRTGKFVATFRAEGPVPKLDDNATTILFRMVQEIINNIVKHSQARRISIAFHASEKMLTLACTDDGVGFDVQEKIQQGGSGLLNLRNRARLIRAQLSIKSSHHSGTSVVIQIPL